MAAGALALPAACRAAPRSEAAAEDTALVAALDAGAGFLIDAQDEDGGWRGSRYAVFRDGAALTPFIAKALAALPFSAERFEAASRGARFVQSLLDSTGNPRIPLAYPVYTASLAAIAIMVLRKAAESARTVDVSPDPWIAILQRHQLNEQLGWRRDDLAFGGWGYSLQPPARPEPGSMALPFDSDLSSTLFAASALRMAGRSSDDPAIGDARVFVERCQNLSTDGGFFFTPTNEIQNKAGVSGVDTAGRVRFHSYGSATCDGLRALLQCGVDREHPRITRAIQWIERHFSTVTNPGEFTPEREPDRDAAYFYYMWSLAHAVRLLGVRHLRGDGGAFDWTVPVERALLARQQPDGSWTNRFSFMKEDDPLVATPLALAALGCALHIRTAE